MVTLAGISMEVKLDALWNAPFPMLANWDPVSNVTELKLDIGLNALFPMLVTLVPIETLTKILNIR
jgi:hypothetical protein